MHHCSWTVCDQWILRWDTFIVLTSRLRLQTIALAHKGHLHVAIVGTKENLRSKVRWPCMDKAAEKFCKSCYECQLLAHPYPLEPLTLMKFAKGFLVRPSHRPSTATPIWTINTTCHQLLRPLSWVCGSNWPPRRDPQQPWSSCNSQVRQWTVILIKTIPRIL